MIKGLVSIIIPVYNSVDGIAGCLDSILAQTYPDFEVIIVDDGSEDGSTQLCQEYAERDARIQVLTKKNEGVSAARNQGIKLAKGEFLQFVDSDDCLYPSFCEKMTSYLNENPVDVVICGYKMMKDGQLRRPKPFLYVHLAEFMPQFGNYYNHCNNTINAPWNKMYRHSAVHAEFPTDLSKGEDLLFNLEILETAEGILFVGDVLYIYNNLNEQSLTAKFREDGFEIEERLYRRVRAFYQRHASNRRYHFLDACFLDGIKGKMIALVKRSGKEKKECVRLIRKWIRHPSVRRLLRYKKGFRKKDMVLLYLIQFRLAGVIYHYYRLIY